MLIPVSNSFIMNVTLHNLGLHPALCGMKLEYVIICLKYIKYKIYVIKKYHRNKHRNGMCELKACFGCHYSHALENVITWCGEPSFRKGLSPEAEE
jgi:hypothetical protein